MEIKQEHIQRFEEYVGKLHELMNEIQTYCPAAWYWETGKELHLMKGPSHDACGTPVRHNDVSTVVLHTSSSCTGKYQ